MNTGFCPRIHTGCGFIENKDAGIRQDGAGDGKQLPLALTQVAGPLREPGLIPVRQLTDEVIGIRQPGCFHAFFIGCLESPVAQVFHYGIGEEECILQDDPQLPAEICFRNVANVVSIDRDTALVYLIESRQQIDNGGLSGACRTHQGDRLAGFRFETHIADDRLVCEITKGDVCETNLSFDWIRQWGIRGVIHFCRRVDHLKDTFGPGQCGLNGIVHVCELAQRVDEILGIGNERCDHPYSNEALQCQVTAQTYEHNDKEVAQHPGERHEHERIRIGIHSRFVDFLIAGMEPLDGTLTAAEGLDNALAADGFLHHAVDLSQLLL